MVHTGLSNEIGHVTLLYKASSTINPKEPRSLLQRGPKSSNGCGPTGTATLGGVWMPLWGTDWVVSWCVPFNIGTWGGKGDLWMTLLALTLV